MLVVDDVLIDIVDDFRLCRGSFKNVLVGLDSSGQAIVSCVEEEEE